MSSDNTSSAPFGHATSPGDDIAPIRFPEHVLDHVQQSDETQQVNTHEPYQYKQSQSSEQKPETTTSLKQQDHQPPSRAGEGCEEACRTPDSVAPLAYKPESVVQDSYKDSSETGRIKTVIDPTKPGVTPNLQAKNGEIAANNRSPHDMNGWPDQNMLPALVQSQNAEPGTSAKVESLPDLRSPHDMNAIPDGNPLLRNEPTKSETPSNHPALQHTNAGESASLRQQAEAHGVCGGRGQAETSSSPHFAPASFEYSGSEPIYALHHHPDDIPASSFAVTRGIQPLHFAPASFEYSSKTLEAERPYKHKEETGLASADVSLAAEASLAIRLRTE